MSGCIFYVGLDDTDSPKGMCTTWLGALLAKKLTLSGMKVLQARLVRLNPTIPFRTRGNAAVALVVYGIPETAFDLTCRLVEQYAEFSCENTNPGVVVSRVLPPSDFYWQAVSGHCTLDEAYSVISSYHMSSKGYKIGRGLIGATAAVCSDFPDHTWELLAYRKADRLSSLREVDEASLLFSETATAPHTWDTWDYDKAGPVCIPHSGDPVLFGIRGDSPFFVAKAASLIVSESYDCQQIWFTNQGTDAHLLPGDTYDLVEGRSYLISGLVSDTPKTGEGGHVTFHLDNSGSIILCMAFEPTKKFRDKVRNLKAGDVVMVAGSFLRNTINLEKFCLIKTDPVYIKKPPVCQECNRRMTSAGTGKGYKCRRCGRKEKEPVFINQDGPLLPGWYEVPPGARRHLSRPLIRGYTQPDSSYLPINRKNEPVHIT